MYYLPVRIENRRIHICKFTPSLHHASEKEGFEFIISNISRNTLFTLTNGAKLLSESGTATDRLVISEDSELGWASNFKLSFEKEKDSLCIELMDLEEIGQFVVDGEADLHELGLDYELKAGGLFLFNTSNTERALSCVFKYKDLTSKVMFQIAAPEHIANAVFDFGSEASQVAIMFHNAEEIKPLPLIPHAYNNFYKDKFGENGADYSHFYQYEQGHNHVLLSYFFLKAQQGIQNKIGVPFEEGNDELIKILTKHTDRSFFEHINKDNVQGHFLLPNLKLADSVDFPGISFEGANNQKQLFDNKEVKDHIFETIMSQFVHLLLKRVDQYYTVKGLQDKNAFVHLRLNLLVPNIYSQQKVFDILHKLNKNIRAIYALGCFNTAFKGIELVTTSESDASFNYREFERSNTNKRTSDETNCLVIDAGKGTTDLSVIRCFQNPNKYLSTYRSGITGAGNLMTYAIMEGIVAVITDNDPQKSKKFIKDNILTADAYQQLQFFNLLETIKKRYDALQPVTSDEVLALEYHNVSFMRPHELNIRTLNTFLQGMLDANKRMDDYYGIVTDAVNSYCEKLIREVKLTEVKSFYNIRFAGRAFKFSPLKERMMKQLKAFSKDIAPLQYPKRNCLLNSLDNRVNISESSNMVGIPLTKNGSVMNWEGKLAQRIGLDLQDQKEPKPDHEKTSDFFFSGIQLSKDHLRDIKIGGHQYMLENSSLLHTDETEFNLIYAGDDFLVRSTNESTRLVIEPRMNGEDVDAIRSLFPNIPAEKDVPITERKTKPADPDIISNERIVQKYLRMLTNPRESA